jgi:hypothetical protein
MRIFSLAVLLGGLALIQSGCVARTLVGVATAPVRIAGKAVDLATTSQSEADQNRGRDLRRREERLGQLERSYNRETERCADGNSGACERRDAVLAEINALRPTIPAEPD